MHHNSHSQLFLLFFLKVLRNQVIKKLFRYTIIYYFSWTYHLTLLLFIVKGSVKIIWSRPSSLPSMGIKAPIIDNPIPMDIMAKYRGNRGAGLAEAFPESMEVIGSRGIQAPGPNYNCGRDVFSSPAFQPPSATNSEPVL